jgi:hypothetical protein
MKLVVFFTVPALVLTGCLATPPAPVTSVPTSVCTGERQCSVMWAAAHDWVSHVGRMQVVQTMPDSIATYPARMDDDTTMSGTVTKRPLQDGSYEIGAQFACWNREIPCTRLEQSGVNLFNTMVRAAGEGAK